MSTNAFALRFNPFKRIFTAMLEEEHEYGDLVAKDTLSHSQHSAGYSVWPWPNICYTNFLISLSIFLQFVAILMYILIFLLDALIQNLNIVGK